MNLSFVSVGIVESKKTKQNTNSYTLSYANQDGYSVLDSVIQSLGCGMVMFHLNRENT